MLSWVLCRGTFGFPKAKERSCFANSPEMILNLHDTIKIRGALASGRIEVLDVEDQKRICGRISHWNPREFRSPERIRRGSEDQERCETLFIYCKI